jgi:cob(I)alamin adenosyltransferase
LGNRLSRIYTRTGDDGTTGMADGARVSKCDPRIDAVGTVDETNCVIGLLLAERGLPSDLQASLLRIQHELFEIGAELALPGYRRIGPQHVQRLEAELDALNANLPPLVEFVLPGGNRAAAECHLARATCRRAERCVWAIVGDQAVDTEVARYLNRLSDFLFVAARTLARRAGGSETLWQR